MKDIEVGEYGRTNFGKIIKFAWLEDSEGKTIKNKVILINGNEISNDLYYFHKEENIVKHSKQLIDLIEVEDIVNGMKILHIEDNKLYVEWNNEFEEFTGFLENKDIKTILTKEQYQANCYKVGGEEC
jgi:hypothetical protein